MWITRIELDAFGCIRGLREDLARGLHVFFGPNESGKSTLQQAIFVLLYNFYEGTRARPQETREHERYRPWTGASYAGRLEFEIETGDCRGHRFRVQRDFSNRDVPTTVWDLTAGKEMTDEYDQGRHGTVAFARAHLGMSRRVFDACAFVSQGELFDLADERRASPQEIGDTIINLADTARRDVSAQSAIERLRDVLRQQVGGPQARTTPLPAARRELDQALAEIAEIDRSREEVAHDAARLDDSLERAHALRDEVRRIRYLHLQAQLDDLRTRLQQLEELDNEDARLGGELEQTAEFAAFPIEERDAALARWNTIESLRTSLAEDASRVADARERLRQIASELDPARRRARELDHLRDYPLDREHALDAAVASWKNARLLAQEAARRVNEATVAAEALEEYERLEERVCELTQEQIADLRIQLVAPPPGWLRRGLRAVGHAFERAGRWLWRGVNTLVRWALRRTTERVEQDEPHSEDDTRRVGALSREAIAEIIQQYERHLELAPQVRRYRDAQRDAEDAASDAGIAERAARDQFEDIVDDASDVDRAHAVFHERCAGRRELETLEDQNGRLEREAETLHRVVEAYEQIGFRLARLEEGLKADLEAWIGKPGTLEPLLGLFEDCCSKRRSHDGAKAGLAGNGTKRSLILKGRSRRELEEQLRVADDGVARLEEEVPALCGARTDESVDALDRRLKERDEQLNALERAIEGLRTKIETKLAGQRARAEVEEEIERLRKQVRELERFRDELTIAAETIERAMTEAHRNFAPSIGRFLGEGMSQITGGRYSEMLLDPSTLRLTTEVPETRTLRDVEFLSRGTRAAAYLLLRAGLAQHMSALGEPVPLILDDPLVDLDDVRLMNFLNVLEHLAEEVQVLLFTKDETTRAWFETHCVGDTRYGMTMLSGPQAADPESRPVSGGPA